jgi:hypothetical protein
MNPGRKTGKETQKKLMYFVKSIVFQASIFKHSKRRMILGVDSKSETRLKQNNFRKSL